MSAFLKFISVSCFLGCSSGKQSIKYLTDLDQANIKGRVTKLVTETYEFDSLDHIGKLESVTIEIFNELGYTITDTTKDFVEKNQVVNFFTYNKNGSLSSLSTFENGKKQSKMLLKYDDSKCINIKIYDSNDKLENYYDNIEQTELGLLSSLNSYDTNGKLTMSFVNDYDSIYQIRATAKDSTGIVTAEVKIQLTDKKYQENTLEITYLKDSTVQKYEFYKYESWDTTGNWIQQTVFNDKWKATKMVKRIFSYQH